MEIKYKSHAEDFGWPPKKADKTINANTKAESNVVELDFTPVKLAAAA